MRTTILLSLLLAPLGAADHATAKAAVTAVPGGYQATYPVNLPNGTSNGSDIRDVVILEWDDAGRIHADLPFAIAGRGFTSLSHLVGFRPTAALVLGYGLGIPGVGDEKDHVFSLTSSSFAAEVAGLNWSEAFPGVTPETRVRHSTLIELLRQAAAGDQAALDAVVEFARTEGVRAAFDPARRLRVLEWTTVLPIDALDLGDAPDTYATLLASNGPSHDLDPTSTLYLGACVDSEDEGQPSVASDGDDSGVGTGALGVCTGSDDEDGVVFGALAQCGPGSATVTASQAGLLDAWVDFDGSGSFDAGEQIAASLAVAPGPNPVGFPVPCNAVVTPTHSRFRISTSGGLPPQGPAPNGEVEDHPLTIAGAPVLSATKTSTFDPMVHDNDGDMLFGPGDDLLYSIEITNAGAADAIGVAFTDSPDANTTLVAGTVTTTQGTVTTGNTGGDLSVAVDVGTLSSSGGSVSITFLVTVNDPLPAGVDLVSNQGTVTGSNSSQLVTDDPDDPAVDDPTDDALAAGTAQEIPTLSFWAMLLFAGVLTVVALRAVGR